MLTLAPPRASAAVGVIVALLAVVAAGGCSGGFYDASSKNTDELIATVGDATKDPEPGSGHGSPRCSAAEELGRRKATAAVDALVAAMRDGQVVATCAASALGQIGNARAVQALLTAWEEDRLSSACGDPGRCLEASEAISALEAIGAPALDQLIPLVGSADWIALSETPRGGMPDQQAYELGRLLALMQMFGRIGDLRAEPVLLDKLANSPDPTVDEIPVRLPAEALAKIYRGNVDHLLPLLESQRTVGIAYGIIGLGKAGTEPALTTALMRFGDLSMARFYLNCGNAQLESAAGGWAKANGYEVTTQLGAGGLGAGSWGSL